MDEEMDAGLDMAPDMDTGPEAPLDVDSFMDAVPEVEDTVDFSDFSSDADGFDVDNIMDSTVAAEDLPAEPVEMPEESIPDIPAEVEAPIELGEEIPTETEEPVEMGEEIPAETEEPVEMGEEIPVETEEPVEIAEEIPAETEEPVEIAEEKPAETEEPIEMGEEIPPETEEPIEMGEEIPPETEEPVEIAEEIPAETEEPIELGEEIPTETEEPVELGEEIPAETEEPVEIAEEIPAETEEPVEIAEEKPAETEEPVEMGGEIPAEVESTERVYDEFEDFVRMDNEDFYESGTFYTQGINEYGYSGTCGETSMASTINRVLGTNEFTENKVLDVAVQEGLCDTDSFDDSGGTTTEQFMELYERMNETCGGQLEVECHDYDQVLSMEEVAQRLEEGCTINVAVDSATLWGETDPMGSPFPEERATDHWITVTDVRRDESGAIQGFDIIDSGGGESYVDADKYEAMCYGTENLELTDPTCVVVSKKDELISETGMDVPPAETELPIPDAPAETALEMPKPNEVYEADGYRYETDGQGRVVSASGELHLTTDHIRDPEAQLMAGGEDRLEHDDGGHLIAARFGGSDTMYNLVAEDSFINRSQFKRLENAWARDLERGNRVLVNIEPYYGVDSQRPTHITGEYTVIRPDGSSFKDYFSFTNDDLRKPEYQEDFDGDSSFYSSLSPADQQAYDEAMEEKLPRIDEGRVFTYDDAYEQFSGCPEDSDEAFELQRLIHQPGEKRQEVGA